MEIRYDNRRLLLCVRDDGKGIDPKVLAGGGREGHFGLAGMQERAKLVGGKLTVFSRLESGTEAALTIPASTAYGNRRLHAGQCSREKERDSDSSGGRSPAVAILE